MEEKQALLARFLPRAVLKAVTPEAARAVPTGVLVDDMVAILRYPFRVGRESRVRVVEGEVQRIERPRRGTHAPTNDLYLVDAGELLQVSREHFVIEEAAGVGYRVVDCNSACGVGVAGVQVGGDDKGGSAPLKDGDVISVGTRTTPYRYQFIVLG